VEVLARLAVGRAPCLLANPVAEPVIGNPLFALQLKQNDVRSIFGQFRNSPVDAVAGQLDRKVEALIKSVTM
jgi:hypothetical protein